MRGWRTHRFFLGKSRSFFHRALSSSRAPQAMTRLVNLALALLTLTSIVSATNKLDKLDFLKVRGERGGAEEARGARRAPHAAPRFSSPSAPHTRAPTFSPLRTSPSRLVGLR